MLLLVIHIFLMIKSLKLIILINSINLMFYMIILLSINLSHNNYKTAPFDGSSRLSS